LISVYCSGRFAFTFCTTAFAVSHNPHGLRVKKVMRQSRRRDVARNMTEIALTRAMDGGVAVVWISRDDMVWWHSRIFRASR
jgi:hypothetical protein